MAGRLKTDPAILLDMNGNQLGYYVVGVKEESFESYQRDDSLNHMLGKYNSYAYHNPKKYPKQYFSCFDKNKVKKQQTNNQMKDTLLMWAYVLGGEEVK